MGGCAASRSYAVMESASASAATQRSLAAAATAATPTWCATSYRRWRTRSTSDIPAIAATPFCGESGSAPSLHVLAPIRATSDHLGCDHRGRLSGQYAGPPVL